MEKVSVYFIYTKVWIWSNPFSGYQVALVHMVFEIPDWVIEEVYTILVDLPLEHLAYIEWFSPIPRTSDLKHSIYRVSRLMENGHRSASIIQVESIVYSIHLIPHFR